MRTSVLAIIAVAGSALAFPATAQLKQAAPSEQTRQEMHQGVDQQMQRDADKGVYTRNSGDSGYVADEPKPGASAHPPGEPEQTTGSTGKTASALRSAKALGRGDRAVRPHRSNAE
jgi:hypothetical protein